MPRAGNGAAFLPRLRVLVERKHFDRGGVTWLLEGEPHTSRDDAEASAQRLRKQGFQVRVRPVVQ